MTSEKDLPHERTTRYTIRVRETMEKMGHATNGELLAALHDAFPHLSATTIHRITTRMVERGELRLAPSGSDNNLRFDANTTAHDHFMCEKCGILKDASIGEQLRPQIEAAIGDDCSISGNLTVSGICKECRRNT